jgi:hypothetical protein
MKKGYLIVGIITFQVLSFQFHKPGQFSLKKVFLAQPTYEKEEQMSIPKNYSSVKTFRSNIDQFSAYTSLAPAVNSWVNFAALFWYLLTREGFKNAFRQSRG